MPFSFSWSKKVGRGLRVSASKTGLSASKRLGPVSLSTRGRASVRLGKGLSFRTKLW